MAGDTVIADVGETLVGLLRGRLWGSELADESKVALASPAALGADTDVRLSLFLYRVSENEHLRNTDWTEVKTAAGTVDPERRRAPPMALDLYYLLTAYPSEGGSDETTKTRDQHRVLGRAMQVFRDNAVVTGSDLQGSLVADDELRLAMEPNPTEEMFNIWNTFEETPYQPSVAYVVGPVLVESREPDEQFTRLVEGRLELQGREPEGEDG
jgi:hypothetical protein